SPAGPAPVLTAAPDRKAAVTPAARPARPPARWSRDGTDDSRPLRPCQPLPPRTPRQRLHSRGAACNAARGWRGYEGSQVARGQPTAYEIDRTAMAAYPSHLRASTSGCRWLMLAAQMAGLANGGWRPAPYPSATGRVCPPRIATRTLGAEAG